MSTKFKPKDASTPITADWLNSIEDLRIDTPVNLANLQTNINAVQTSLNTYKADVADTATVSKGAALVGRASQVVDSVAVLRTLLKTSASRYAETAGYYAPGDGGSAKYYYDSADTTSVDNGGTIIVAADGGRWKMFSLSDFNILQFGVKRDGTDTSARLNAAVAQCIALGRRCLKAPAGVYVLGNQISGAFNGINGFSLEGKGSAVTEFRFQGSANGFAFTEQDGQWWLETSPSSGFNFTGFTITTNNVNSGVGFYLQGGDVTGRPPRRVMFRDVESRGLSDFSHSWNKHTVLADVGEAWFDSCRWVIGGPGNLNNFGVELTGTAGKDPSGYYFNNCEALYGSRFIQVNSSNVEGIYLTQCSHVAGARAVFWSAGAESGLHVIGGHYNNSLGNFYLQGVFDFTITNALLYSEGHGAAEFRHIYVTSGSRGTITGNICVTSGGAGQEHGVYIENSVGGSAMGITVEGNSFNGLTGYGVVLQATAQYVTVGENGYNGTVLGDVLNLNGGPNANRVARRRYTASVVVAVAGGAITETVNIPIPAGTFRAKPDVGMIVGEGIQCIGFYDQPSGTSTATNMKVDLRKLDGVNFSAGNIRLSLIAEQ